MTFTKEWINKNNLTRDQECEQNQDVRPYITAVFKDKDNKIQTDNIMSICKSLCSFKDLIDLIQIGDENRPVLHGFCMIPKKEYIRGYTYWRIKEQIENDSDIKIIRVHFKNMLLAEYYYIFYFLFFFSYLIL
jgi:hypothetical protein